MRVFIYKNNMKNNYLLCFDLDGTLIDSRGDIAGCINYALNKFGLKSLDEKIIADLVGHGIRNTVVKALNYLNDKSADREEAGNLAVDYYAKNPVVKTTVYNGVREGLKKLKEAGFYIGVVTNKIQPLTEKVLSILNIIENLDFIHGAECGYPLKPAPDSILAMIKKANVLKENTFMIGDGMTDITTGKNAGVKICLVTYGYNTPQNVDVDMKVDSFSELTEKFLSLL